MGDSGLSHSYLPVIYASVVFITWLFYAGKPRREDEAKRNTAFKKLLTLKLRSLIRNWAQLVSENLWLPLHNW